MQVKVKIVNAEIQAGSVGSVIGVAPSRARRWCSNGLAVLVDDRYTLEELPSRAELDPEWIAKQNKAPNPAPAFEVGSEGGKEDKSPTAEGKETTGKKTTIETETGPSKEKADKKKAK